MYSVIENMIDEYKMTVCAVIESYCQIAQFDGIEQSSFRRHIRSVTELLIAAENTKEPEYPVERVKIIFNSFKSHAIIESFKKDEKSVSDMINELCELIFD